MSQAANDRFFAEMMRKRHRQVFWQDSCRLANSYYFDQNGDVPLRPTTTAEAYWRSRSSDPGLRIQQLPQNCTPRVRAPSTTRLVPVMKLAAEAAQEPTALAISRASPSGRSD